MPKLALGRRPEHYPNGASSTVYHAGDTLGRFNIER